MSRVELDPERGQAVAAELKRLGAKRVLVTAAELGYITQLACAMPHCFCPEELGGANHFEPFIAGVSDWRSDWMPTHEHFPIAKRHGGREAVDNAILAHRICNRLDYAITAGRSHAKDLERILRSRDEAIRHERLTAEKKPTVGLLS
jgi:hypothetical protein